MILLPQPASDPDRGSGRRWLSPRLGAVRAVAHPACRRRRYPRHRLGQYRRNQCAAHRAQGAGRWQPCCSMPARGLSAVLAWLGGGSDGDPATQRLSRVGRSPSASPVWLDFKGGKGVATMLGITFALDRQIGCGSAATWLGMTAVTRISSVGACRPRSQRQWYLSRGYWISKNEQYRDPGYSAG